MHEFSDSDGISQEGLLFCSVHPQFYLNLSLVHRNMFLRDFYFRESIISSRVYRRIIVMFSSWCEDFRREARFFWKKKIGENSLI
jgi:hypothetical protein